MLSLELRPLCHLYQRLNLLQQDTILQLERDMYRREAYHKSLSHYRKERERPILAVVLNLRTG